MKHYNETPQRQLKLPLTHRIKLVIETRHLAHLILQPRNRSNESFAYRLLRQFKNLCCLTIGQAFENSQTNDLTISVIHSVEHRFQLNALFCLDRFSSNGRILAQQMSSQAY